VSRLIAVGEEARPILRGAALEGSWAGAASWVPDADTAIAVLRAELRARDVVLVKASRAVRLERVAEAIGTEPAPDAVPAAGPDGGDRT
jgi:UDP-N-acetylmuramoyl-tripeptide--D-alanyl-D-alanine ligase